LRLQAALSTTASSLPIGAVGLVPPLHDGMPPTDIPMTATPNEFSKMGDTKARSNRDFCRRD
jgi:hypothetical protein